ncbi:MAG: ABC transporter ATP-binding protein, partial [Planctomycetia bacterium]|nr:ABC transporter ATP-binding protein [Planctomycetia bacterium]
SFQGQTLNDWYEIKVKEKNDLLEKTAREQVEIRDQNQKIENELKAPDLPDRAEKEEILHKNKKRAKALAVDQKSLEKDLKWYGMAKPYIDQYAPQDPFLTVAWLMILVLITTYFKSVLGFVHGYLSGKLGMLCCVDIRNIFFQKLLGYEVNRFSQSGVSDAMSRFTGDIGSLSNGISLFYGKLVREPLKMFACLAGAIFISWQLFLCTCIFAPIALVLIVWMAKTLKRVARNSMAEMVSMFSQISESFRSIRVVKSFNREDFELEKFNKTNLACYRRGMKTTKYGSLSAPMTECLGMSVMVMAVLLGAWLVINQETSIFGIRMCSQPLDLGTLILFYGFLIGASDPVRRLSDFFLQMQGAAAAADRVYDMIDQEIALTDPENPVEIHPFDKKIVFQNVSYSYPKYANLNQMVNKITFWSLFAFLRKKKEAPKEVLPEMQIVLKKIDLEIAFGETIAIVGPSGGGKSTLLNLIPRFYDPSGGSITFDSIPYKDLRMKDLRDQIGLVTQEPVLFDDTVFENIRYGVPDASREAVIEAAKKAYAHDFIVNKLEKGYETSVGPGGGLLSGGQRQRIALARALLKNPRILLLDEATSQIDLQSEQYIHEALEKFVGSRTTVIVTHRLSAIRLADRIVVVQEGEIESIGTHEELLEKSPFYASLWQVKENDKHH